jgi:hypothetical protein
MSHARRSRRHPAGNPAKHGRHSQKERKVEERQPLCRDHRYAIRGAATKISEPPRIDEGKGLLVGNTIALVSAMAYDWTVNAIGPFGLTEYLGLALVWRALAVTAPFRAVARAVPGIN